MCFMTPDVLLIEEGTNEFPSDSLPDSDPALLDDLVANVQNVLLRSFSNSESTIRPTGNESKNQDPGPSMSSMPLTPSDNISFLVEIRQQHQTKEAEKGVRLASTGTKASRQHTSSGASEEPISERRLLAQKIRDIMKAVDNDKENIGSSTGLNRRIRWTKTPGLYSPSPALSDIKNEQKSGNSANALEVAQKAANSVRFLMFVRHSRFSLLIYYRL